MRYSENELIKYSFNVIFFRDPETCIIYHDLQYFSRNGETSTKAEVSPSTSQSDESKVDSDKKDSITRMEVEMNDVTSDSQPKARNIPQFRRVGFMLRGEPLRQEIESASTITKSSRISRSTTANTIHSSWWNKRSFHGPCHHLKDKTWAFWSKRHRKGHMIDYQATSSAFLGEKLNNMKIFKIYNQDNAVDAKATRTPKKILEYDKDQLTPWRGRRKQRKMLPLRNNRSLSQWWQIRIFFPGSRNFYNT